MGTGFFCVNISFTGSSLWVFIFALFCCYHILEIPFTLGTSAVMWSLQTSLQLVVILDKYCGSLWVHLNPLHWCFHKEIILSKLFHPFLSWQTDLNEKSNKSTLHDDKAAKQREFTCFKYSPATFAYFFNFNLFSKL